MLIPDDRKPSQADVGRTAHLRVARRARSGVELRRAAAASSTSRDGPRVERPGPSGRPGPPPSTPNAARTRIAAAAIEASRSPPWNSRVDDERQRLGPALDVAGEHDRRPELAERPRPGHDQAGGQGRAGERHGDRAGTAAAPRRRRPGRRPRGRRSTPAIPVRAERMKNGAETNVWARITAIVVNGIEIPSELERRGQAARAGRTPAAGRARRPTAAARSAGRRSPRASPCRGTRAGPGRRPAAGRGRP